LHLKKSFLPSYLKLNVKTSTFEVNLASGVLLGQFMKTQRKKLADKQNENPDETSSSGCDAIFWDTDDREERPPYENI